MITSQSSNKILGYLLIQRLAAYLLVLRYIQYLQKIQVKGNLTSKTAPEQKQDYYYDQTYRLLQSLLTKLKNKGKDKDRDKEYEQKEENYSYDPVGNRIFGPKPIEFYSYNRGNQLTNDKKHQYEYDRNGNLTKKTELDDNGKTKITVYTYDFENRLDLIIRIVLYSTNKKHKEDVWKTLSILKG